MEIPILDLKAQYETIKGDVTKAINRVVESQTFVLSPEVKALEEEVAAYTGVTCGAGVASGTDALILSLKAAGVGEGDLVVTSPFTFVATAEAISILGAVPVFSDIDPLSYNIDPDILLELIREADSDARDSIKAIIPVHLYGQCADMKRLMPIASKYGFKVIEDCAQSIGAMHNGKRAGSFGDAGCMSFFPSKNLGGFGDGGMVVSSDRKMIDHIKRLRVHGSREQYIHEEVGYNSRLDSLQAAILRVKLKKLDEWIEGRKRIAAKYDAGLSAMGIKPPAVTNGNDHTYYLYTIAVDDRDELLKHLNEKGVMSRVYYPVPLHLQPCYKSLGYSIGSLPVSESIAERVLSLPIYPELSDEQVNYVLSTIKEFYR